MVQVTFTDDARRPKVITFGGSPLVKWYGYIRDDQQGKLFVRRSVDGVLDPEVEVMGANPPIFPATETIGVSWFAFHVDPTDVTKAYIYFLADGTLWRSVVTSTPVGEEPTTQQFNRGANRYERAELPLAPSVPFDTAQRQTTIPTPGIALVETTNPLERQLIVTVPSAAGPLFEPDTIEIYRLIDGGNGTLYYSGPVPLGRQLILVVATNTATFTKWAARVTKQVPNLKSVFVSVIDDGSTDTDAYSGLAPGVPFDTAFQKVDRAPVKKSFTETATELPLSPSAPFETSFSKVDRAPIKRSFEEAATPLPLSPGTPFEPFFQKS